MPNKKTWAHFVRDCRLVYLNKDRFAYLYGANGECPGTYAAASSLVNQLWNLYPSHYEDTVIKRGHTKHELIKHVIGKICYDCSAFVCAMSQNEGSIYDMPVIADLSSYALHDIMINKTDPKAGFWGNVLWLPGHVAVDVGNGLAIDFSSEFNDVREYRFVDPDSIKFELSGSLPWLDYSGAINS